MNALLNWLDKRTGINKLTHEALYEMIPSGARFRYATGSMLVFAFVTQAVTGIYLWMAYSPSSQTAYESVWWIQNEMTGGWMVRGIHHFMAQAMVVVMGLHMLQVIVDGAYKAPRELNYWLGLVLLQIVMGLGLTGYLLPWDQKGYWATNVATNLMTLVPFVGKDLQLLAQGGSEYGHHTLTRFFALHAGVLPASLVGFLALHIAVFRKHGITAHVTPGRPDEYFWPKQVLFDAIACLALLTVVMLCAIHWDIPGALSGKLPAEHQGAELGAPSDPSEQYSAARPEWYFLFLFQLLKYFPGKSEIYGAIVIPGAIFGVLTLMPLWGHWKAGHRFNVAFMVGLLLGAGALTLVALREDNYAELADRFGWDTKTEAGKKAVAGSRDFLVATEKAKRDAHRMNELIRRRVLQDDGKLSPPLMIPKQGAVYLMRNDPLTQGPRLFERNCAGCHEWRPPGELTGVAPIGKIAQAPLSTDGKIQRDAEGNPVYGELPLNGAPNLWGFGGRQWIAGMLDKSRIGAVGFSPIPSPEDADPESPEANSRKVASDYFGNTAHRDGRMVQWLKKHADGIDKDDWTSIVVALSAQARLPRQAKIDQGDADLVKRGVALIEKNCASCHRFGDAGQLGLAPDLTGYASYEWTLALVSDPTHARFYRMENDRMPSFARDLTDSTKHQTSVRELSLIVDWLREEYYNPHDEIPVLPHSEEVARATVAAGRTLEEPRATVIGAKASPPVSAKARVEKLFADNCLACHSRADESGQGGAGQGMIAKNPTAPNLAGIGSRAWLAGLLDAARVDGPDYFGSSSHKSGEMVGYVKDNLTTPDDAKKQAIVDVVAALSAEAALPAQATLDATAKTDGTLDRAKTAFSGALECANCHKWGDAGDVGSAPVLTGWGSKDWLVRMIADPRHAELYGDNNDRMPSFGVPSGQGKGRLLTDEEIDLLAKWLRGEPLE